MSGATHLVAARLLIGNQITNPQGWMPVALASVMGNWLLSRICVSGTTKRPRV